VKFQTALLELAQKFSHRKSKTSEKMKELFQINLVLAMSLSFIRK